MVKRRPLETKSSPVARRIEISADANVPIFYANNASVEVSTFDVKIRLGQVASTTPEVVAVKDVAHVYMSHDHFRAYVNAMNSLIPSLDAVKTGTFPPPGDAKVVP